jgi:hypothetical protein
MTVTDFTFRLNALALKHKINDNTIKDLLCLFSLALPQPNSLPKTLNKMNKQICARNDLKKFQICIECQATEEIKMSETKKECSSCKILLSQFITFNVAQQIKSILLRNEVGSNLSDLIFIIFIILQ